MSGDLTFGVRLVADGKQLVGEVRMSREELEKLGVSTGKASSEAAKLNDQNKNLGSSFGGMAARATAATAVLAGTVGIIRSSIRAATEYQNALNGLASVARYAGENVSSSMSNALQLTNDGMMSVNESATALKNLLARGFSTDQAVEMINRFKDSAAFGRQSSLAFGQAVVSATEGIKNENSVLVDNAGVTKNVSVMWKEYADAHGKSVNNLSLAEKRQAEYNGILRETEAQIGNTALAAQGMGGATARLDKTISEISVTIGQSFTPAAIGMTDTLTRGFKSAAEYGIKPFLFMFEDVGITAGEIAARIGVVGEFLSSPSRWLNPAKAQAEMKAQFKVYEDLAEQMRLDVAKRLDGAVTPQMGKDSGARRSDSDDEAAKKAEEARKRSEEELKHFRQLSDAATKHIAVLEAQAGQEGKLTESQKKLIELGANYKQGLTAQNEAVQQGVIASLAQAAALEMEAVAKAEAEKASKASAAAWDESAKAIDKANTASKEYVNQLQFENSLLGLSTLEVQKRTEARKIDLALEKELLALRGNDKLKAEPAALKAAEDAARKAAEAAKAGAEVEIEARQRVTTSWEFGSREAIRKYDEAVKNSAAQAESLYTKAFKGAEDAVTKFVTTGKADIRDFANAVIEEFVRINISRPLVSGAAGFLGDWFGGLFGGGSSPTGMAGFSASQMAGPVMASANGNVFSGAGIGAYSGRVVDKPTVFPFARGIGLMGEAGPEAILPLTRVNGRLGVQAQGGGASVTVNVINQSGAQVRTQERQDGSGGMTLDVIIEQIESGIARNVSRGAGALAGSMERSYGLNRAAGAY